MNERLLIIGASGRAAAQSALRAGFIPTVIDAFGDDDTCRSAECRVDAGYPANLVAVAEQMPPADWFFVGGLENSPSIVDRIATRRRLLGVDGATLGRLRDPWALRAVLDVEGVRFPALRTETSDVPRDGTWLLKSRRSAGGLGVSIFNEKSRPQIDRNRYLEHRIEGRSYGVTYIGDGRDARLVGMVEQQTVDSDPRHPFLYGGAVGPVEPSDDLRGRLEALGRRTAGEFGLLGLFGIDVILEGDTVWMLEVNPRYTASVELLEVAYGRPLIADHVRACRERTLPPQAFSPAGTIVGKRIVYAGATGGTITAEFNRMLWSLPGDGTLPAAADISPAGSSIGAYAPLVTVMASGTNASHVADALDRRAAEISRQFLRTSGR